MARARTTTAVVVREPARKRSRAKVKSSRKIPVAIMLGLVPGIMWAVNNPEGSIRQGMERVIFEYTGYATWAKKFSTDAFPYGLYPLLGGIFLHFLANVTGLNRAISKIPYVQI